MSNSKYLWISTKSLLISQFGILGKKEEVGVVSMLILVFSFGSVYDVVVR